MDAVDPFLFRFSKIKETGRLRIANGKSKAKAQHQEIHFINGL